MKNTFNTENGPAFGHHHHDPSGHFDHDGHQHGGSGRGRDRGGFDRAGFDFGPGFGRGGLPGFGPRGQRRASRGDVRAAILSLLADGAQSGYGLIKAIAEKTENTWRPSPGSVYPTLQQLVDEELIEATGNDRRTEYELTDTGRAYVADHQDEIARAWDAAPGRTQADSELFASIGKLMGVIHQLRFAANEEQRKAAIEKIDETRRALYLILAD